MEFQDAELIRSYLRGDAEAVAEIEAWIGSAARAFARRLGELFEDVLQDARIEVYQLLDSGRFRGDARLKSYLWRVVSNTCLDAVRANAKAKWKRTDFKDTPEIAAIAEKEAASSSRSGDVADLILRVLEEIPDHCKRIWAMILEGFSYRELSQEMGVSESALRVRALRCRKKAVQIRERLLETGASR